jgi:hypothetical protein
MNLSLRYKKSLLAISLVALPWLVAVVSSQAQELGAQAQVVTQVDRSYIELVAIEKQFQ